MENATLKPYADYKPSGIDWLGDVPTHWTTPSLGLLFKFKGSGTTPKDDQWYGGSVPWVMTGDLNDTTITTTRRTVLPEAVHEFSALRMYTPGSLIVAMYGATIGKTGLLGIDACTNQACCVLSEPIDGVEVKYLQSVVNSARSNLIEKGYGGGQPNINAHIVRSLRIPVPPPDEQTAIVCYLARADDRILRAISAKERLIELLIEQRQAVIHRAVTRGLDPNMPLEDSGVEWLGDVPAHWDVASLRHRYSQILGKMLDSKRNTGIHPLCYIRNVDVQWDQINVENLPMMDISPDEYDRYTVQSGDLLVCEGGEVGRCAIWSDGLLLCGFQKAIHRLRPLNTTQDVPRFMYYVLRAAALGNAFNDGQVSTITHLTGEKLRAHRLPFPPVKEQTAIVRHLDDSTTTIAAAIDNAQRQIDLLREYRTRLIADVVTGQVDVTQTMEI